MDLPPEVKARLEEQKKQCVFCKIIGGEVPGKKVFEDNQIIALLDINPALEGHTLVLPKEHYPILPYLPPQTFSYLFGLVPQLVRAQKKALLKTGVNVFIANGAAAGQQSPHFLFHLLPRELGDQFDLFEFSAKKTVGQAKHESILAKLGATLTASLRSSGQQKSDTPSFLEPLKSAQRVVYEDAKVLCLAAANPQAIGHLEIYSKEEQSHLDKLSGSSTAYLFTVASYAASALFEAAGAQGTNIILKSGASGDNRSGLLALYVLPRFPDDGLKLLWKPMENKGDLDNVASRLQDYTSSIKPEAEATPKASSTKVTHEPPKRTGDAAKDEIIEAIARLQE